MIDLCFLYADVGNPTNYRALAERCDASAQAHGMRSVWLTPKCDRYNLMLARVGALKDYLRKAQGNIILSDCDMEWVKPPAPLFDEDEIDIGLCWRSGNPAMPYYGGFVMIRHGSEAAINFITEWWFTMATMPKEMHGFWGDQLALASLVGRYKPGIFVHVEGARVKIFDAGRVFFNLQDDGQTPPEGVCAVHRKGARKQ